MNEDSFWVICFLTMVCASIFFIGYGVASSNVIKLKADKWECTTSIIIEGTAMCSEFKLKETK
jgi:hypothetical protein